MGRLVAILGSVFALALVAGGLTEVAFALGRHGTANDILVRSRESASPVVVATPASTPTPMASSSPTPSSTPTPMPTPTPTVAPLGVKTATTNAFVHMRAGKSIYTSILRDLDGGTRVELLTDSDTQWQQVRYSGQVGYIFKAYLTY